MKEDKPQGDEQKPLVTLTDEEALEGASWWAKVDDLPGWEGHYCEVCVAQIDGEPYVVGIRLTPRWFDAPEDVTVDDLIINGSRMTGFPFNPMAATVMQLSGGHPPAPDRSRAHIMLADEVLDFDKFEEQRKKGDPEMVAEVYKAARQSKLNPRAEVMNVFKVSSRTADRYIAKARRSGWIPPYDSERRRKL